VADEVSGEAATPVGDSLGGGREGAGVLWGDVAVGALGGGDGEVAAARVNTKEKLEGKNKRGKTLSSWCWEMDLGEWGKGRLTVCPLITTGAE